MIRLVSGLAPVFVLYVVYRAGVAFEDIQLWVAILTLPFSVVFILAYVPERPWRTWFGTSLLLLAVGVLSYTLSVVLYRLFGSDYPGRSILVISSVTLVLVAMAMRTCVLIAIQYREQEGLGNMVTRLRPHRRRKMIR